MKTTKLYPTRAEKKFIEEIKKKFNLKEHALTGHIPTKLYKRREIIYRHLNRNTSKSYTS